LAREGTQFPSLVAALEEAGGVTQSADLRQIVIQRTTSGASQQTIVANLWQFLETGDLRYNLSLRDGDTILVPTRESFDPHESLRLAAASFAADENRPLNIAIIGEVFRPGPYTVTGTARTGAAGVPGGGGGNSIPPTVTRAIQVAGGIKPEANIREIQVYRRTRDGQEQTIAINLWNLLAEGDITEDILLQEGDTVVVPEADTLLPAEIAEVAAASFSPNTIRVNVVGEVDNPGVIEVPPNTPLSQGVLAAGGFNNRARTSNVELIRLNLNGTVTRSSLAIDFAAGIDESNNPLLRNNDIIIVKRSASATIADTLDTLVTPLGRAFSLFTLPLSILNLFE
ncbi:MAG: sugar ABC transporter substrate-binding protein, partial [Leptolyngbya sp. SIO1D8]|nr:sugar ABC transporter substrate-binding protein [Leptolyngbya sp. SIO1D8]